jgi:streptogramin lyase
VGADGNLYFTELRTGNLGRVIISTLSMSISQTPLGITQGSAIVSGPDNDLWVGGLQTIYQITY